MAADGILQVTKKEKTMAIENQIGDIIRRLDRIEAVIFGMTDADREKILSGIENEIDPDRIAGRLSMANPL